MIEPRKYQNACVEKIWKNLPIEDDMLVKLPTASGKTIIFTLLLEKLLAHFPDASSIVLVNRVNLVGQTIEKLSMLFKQDQLGVYCGSLGEYNKDSKVTVASVDSIKKITPTVTLLIVDEAHNAFNNSSYNGLIDRMRRANPNLKVVRFTATDFTAQDGYIWGKDLPIKKVLYKKTMMEMIALGYIVPPIFKSSKESFDMKGVRTKRGEYIMTDLIELTNDQMKLKKQVKDALPKLKGRKKIVWACASINHAEAVREEISKYEKASIIHSKLNNGEKLNNYNEFENDPDVRHVCSVTMVSEGYDFPPLDAIVCLRPTRSPVLYTQVIGRGLRLSPGKVNGLFLDYGNVVQNLGHPNNPLVKNDKRQKKALGVLICPACETISFAPCKVCTCGYEFFTVKMKKRKLGKNLTNTSADPEFSSNLNLVNTLSCLGWKINGKYVSSTGKELIEVKYSTMTKNIYQYIAKHSPQAAKLRDEYKNSKGNAPKKIKVEKVKGWDKVIERIY